MSDIDDIFNEKQMSEHEPGSLDDFFDGDGDIINDPTNAHWVGMPEFKNDANQDSYKKIQVAFETQEDYEEFAKLIGQNLTKKTKTIWYPKEPARIKNFLMRWIEDDEEV